MTRWLLGAVQVAMVELEGLERRLIVDAVERINGTPQPKTPANRPPSRSTEPEPKDPPADPPPDAGGEQ